MEVYQTNAEGIYVGTTVADPDPLVPGNWLIPAGCVTEPPPAISENQVAVFNAGAWLVLDLVQEPEPPEPPTKSDQEAHRRAAYIDEADPIFFMAQRGEATIDEWTAKIAEIKARFPHPEP